MEQKTALGVLSLIITAIGFSIYIRQTVKHHGIQPHPFSWFLWGLVTAVAFLIQAMQKAGPGSWVTCLTAAVCLLIGTLTLLKNKWFFSLFDWLSLATGLLVFVFYLLAKSPTEAAILATLVDVLGYGSTIKKGWIEPHGDSATSFALNSIKFIPALFALESYSVSTWLYPAILIVVNGGVVIMLLARRQEVGRTTAPANGDVQRPLLKNDRWLSVAGGAD